MSDIARSCLHVALLFAVSDCKVSVQTLLRDYDITIFIMYCICICVNIKVRVLLCTLERAGGVVGGCALNIK